MLEPTIEIRVYYEDTDCGEVVYYANYLRYFERARTEYLRQRGISVANYASRGILFMVVSVEVEYISPAHYDDILLVYTDVSNIKGASFIFNHSIKEKNTEKLIVKGSTRMVCVDKSTKRPHRLPEELRDVLINQ